MTGKTGLIRLIRQRLNDYNEFGVPILNKLAIARIATIVLERLDSDVLTTPQATHVLGILGYLGSAQRTEVLIHDLGERAGRKILGRIRFSENRIELDTILTDEHPAFRFVVAHEIGHWFLHRWRPIQRNPDGVGLEESIETEDEVYRVFGRRELETPVDWIEFQANYFAASLIMPEKTFLIALATAQARLGIERRIGEVWLNPDGQSWADFNMTVAGLRETFGVSRTATIIRLEQLDRLRVHSECREIVYGFSRVGDRLTRRGASQDADS